LEEGARESIKSTKAASKSSVEDRINKVRENFNLQRFGRGDDVAELQAKVDLISKKLDLLTTALTDSGAIVVPRGKRKPAPKKPAANKATSRKAPAKKAAVKKKAAAKRKPASRKSKA
ncbi:MAG: hypothetical protein IMF06_09650, partial [Proteobacteria bacterium]|nr:hypothetical protein [Pseudomonadota bacterium]